MLIEMFASVVELAPIHPNGIEVLDPLVGKHADPLN